MKEKQPMKKTKYSMKNNAWKRLMKSSLCKTSHEKQLMQNTLIWKASYKKNQCSLCFLKKTSTCSPLPPEMPLLPLFLVRHSSRLHTETSTLPPWQHSTRWSSRFAIFYKWSTGPSSLYRTAACGFPWGSRWVLPVVWRLLRPPPRNQREIQLMAPRNNPSVEPSC